MQKEDNYRQLERMFAAGRVPHAMLLISDELDAARDIAASIVCREKTFPACGRCPACRKSRLRVHPDVRLVEAEKGTISVDQVRRLRSDAYVKPNDGDEKAYIIRDASLMTPQAQNALLKVIEQPPPGVTFLLCDRRADGILETLRSRLAVLAFPLAEPESGAYADACAQAIAFAADGNAHGVLEILSRACTTREKAADFWNELICALRDLMVFRETAGRMGGRISDRMRALAERVDTKRLVQLYDLARAAMISVENAGNIALASAAFAVGMQEELF